MFRPFTVAIFKLRLKKLSKQLYLCWVYTVGRYELRWARDLACVMGDEWLIRYRTHYNYRN